MFFDHLFFNWKTETLESISEVFLLVRDFKRLNKILTTSLLDQQLYFCYLFITIGILGRIPL